MSETEITGQANSEQQETQAPESVVDASTEAPNTDPAPPEVKADQDEQQQGQNEQSQPESEPSNQSDKMSSDEDNIKVHIEDEDEASDKQREDKSTSDDRQPEEHIKMDDKTTIQGQNDETKTDGDQAKHTDKITETVIEELGEPSKSVGTSTLPVTTETPEVSSTKNDGPHHKSMRSARRPSYSSTRGYGGSYQNYGLAYLPYKSNFEPSEAARRRADEFIKTLKL